MKKKLKQFPYVFFVFAFIVGFSINYWASQINKRVISPRQIANTPDMFLGQLLSCPLGENAESYKCIVPYVNTYLKKNDIRSFFQLMAQKSQTDARVAAVCHSLGHASGRALYQTYGFTEAINKCTPFCADGCTMGVMEEFLSVNLADHQSKDLVIEKADKACKEFAKGNNVKLSACIHGTGHGIMPLVLYQTQPALDLCKKIQPNERGSCYDAVFMEKFLPSEPIRKISQTENIYEYCSPYESQDELKYRCFGYLPYAWKDWGKSPSEILELCSAPNVHKVGCGRALVRLYLPDYIEADDLTFFELYKKATPELKVPMREYSSIFLVEYSPAKARDFCHNLGNPEQECISYLKNIANTLGIEIP